MNKLPSKETVERLRGQYPEGTRVELISMEDPYTNLRRGEKGSVSFVDDTGTLFVDWGNGSRLGVVWGVDHVKRIEHEVKYETGADFFRDAAVHHGMDEALVIGGRYLSAQLNTRLDDEKKFCRELFETMQEQTAGKADPEKMVYPYDFAKANERLETRYYHDSRTTNNECAVIMDTAITLSCYAQNYYNLDMAAMVVVHDYGFNRVQAVLARQIQSHPSDGRYSQANKEWAAGFDLPEQAFESAGMSSHPILIDGFADRFRSLYRDLNAERYAVPGEPEIGSQVQEYQITRSVWFDDHRGFAVGHNPKAAAPYVCWQFTAENGKREFYWGQYTDSLASATDSYTARVMVHMDGGKVQEVVNPLAAAVGVREEKPSVLSQIREARKNPTPTLPKKDIGKDKSEPEL